MSWNQRLKGAFPLAKASRGHLALGVWACAAGLAALVAFAAALAIERHSARAIRAAFAQSELGWAEVAADGLEITLTGAAPDEAARFRAMNLAGSVVDAARLRDLMEVTPAKALQAPPFSLEMLRSEGAIQVIGLLPHDGEQAKRLMQKARALSGEGGVSSMLETAAYPMPSAWESAFDYALEALDLLESSQISVAPGRVEITAIVRSQSERERLTQRLAAARPSGVEGGLTLFAPRPVLTPFTLRFVLDEAGGRFDACSADTQEARARILAAARLGEAPCLLGLGAPSPSWGQAAELAILALWEMGAGAVTFSDADVSLEVPHTVPPKRFDRAVGALQAALPEVFSLSAARAKEPSESPDEQAEFTAHLARDGQLELRGRLEDTLQKQAVEGFARAHFTARSVQVATRQGAPSDTQPTAATPADWARRVLAGLEALSWLGEGDLVVRPDLVALKGVTGARDASARIAQLLSDQLGQGGAFEVEVRYDQALDPAANIPTPAQCAARVTAITAAQKITFPPASAQIGRDAAEIMNAIAAALSDCPPLPFEIAGHTDSQGAAAGNLTLSRARAEAVLVALQMRGVDVGLYQAKGYGEEKPVASNQTEQGREANRRIEFALIAPDAPPKAP